MVMVEVPATAELLTVNVSTLVVVVGLGLNWAVTPAGNPDGVSVTEPANPPTSLIVNVSVAPALGETVTLVSAAEIVKVPDVPVLTVSAMVAVAVIDPEVPVTITEVVAAAAVLLAVSVSTLLLVAGFVAKAAVTPVGNPVTDSVTLPLNEPTSTIEIVSVALAPSVRETDVLDGVSEKLPVDAAFTVKAMVVVSVSVPEVPVTVTVEVPAAAVLLAVSVSTLLAVAGFVAKAAVTPVGNPETESVTLPLKGLTSAIEIVSVALVPSVNDKDVLEGVREKLPVGAARIVKAMVADAVSVPEVPVMVMVEAPATAVLVAVNVTTLLPVAGLVAKAAVTPVGNPEAANVTLPLNGLTSVTEIVSVPIAPWAIESVAAEAVSEKLPCGGAPLPPVQVTPFSANDAGTALVELFHVALNPIPVRLPPAGMLPL